MSQPARHVQGGVNPVWQVMLSHAAQMEVLEPSCTAARSFKDVALMSLECCICTPKVQIHCLGFGSSGHKPEERRGLYEDRNAHRLLQLLPTGGGSAPANAASVLAVLVHVACGRGDIETTCAAKFRELVSRPPSVQPGS